MSGEHAASPPCGAALAAGAGLWLWAAHALWTLDGVPPARPAASRPEPLLQRPLPAPERPYERFLGIEGLLRRRPLIVVLVVYARRGQRLMRESAAGRVGTGIMLGMLGFAVVWLAEVPFQLAALWWQRRYGVSHQGYFNVPVDSFLQLGSEFVFVCLALAIAMGVAGVTRRWWWLAAAPRSSALALLFTFVSPFLIPETSPVDKPDAARGSTCPGANRGSRGPKLEVQDVHRFTTAPNAESTGFGPTTTVVLWDTLLRDGFNRSEVRFVIGHELGHVAHDDALKGVGWLALFLVPASA